MLTLVLNIIAGVVIFVVVLLAVVGFALWFAQRQKARNEIQRNLRDDANSFRAVGFGFLADLCDEASMFNGVALFRKIRDKLRSISSAGDAWKATEEAFYFQLPARMDDPEQEKRIANVIGRKKNGGSGEYKLVAMPINAPDVQLNTQAEAIVSDSRQQQLPPKFQHSQTQGAPVHEHNEFETVVVEKGTGEIAKAAAKEAAKASP